MTLEPGIYYTPRYDEMIVMVDETGFPRPVSTDYSTLVTHKSEPARLLEMWGPLTRAKVVPEEEEKDVEPETVTAADSAPTAEDVEERSEGEAGMPEPQDPRAERMDLKARALKMAREGLRATAVFGTHATLDPIDLMLVADWLLDEDGPKDDRAHPVPITAEMLDASPHGTVILDAKGIAYQFDDETEWWSKATDGSHWTSKRLVEDVGVDAVLLPGDRRGG